MTISDVRVGEIDYLQWEEMVKFTFNIPPK